jgi:hypothetical protein
MPTHLHDTTSAVVSGHWSTATLGKGQANLYHVADSKLHEGLYCGYGRIVRGVCGRSGETSPDKFAVSSHGRDETCPSDSTVTPLKNF